MRVEHLGRAGLGQLGRRISVPGRRKTNRGSSAVASTMLPGRVLALWLAHVAADELCKFEATLDGRMVAASTSMRDIARSDLPGLATRFVAELGDPSALSTHACPINDRSCIVPLVVEAMEEQWERCRKFNKCAHVPSTAAIAELPTMLDELEARRLDALLVERRQELKRRVHYWEWGAGGSTRRLGLAQTVQMATSVENDACWCDALAGLASPRLLLRCVPTGDENAYVNQVEELGQVRGREHNNGGLDVVLIDGRARAACARAALPALSRGAVVAMPAWPCPGCEAVLQWYDVIEIVGTLALLRPKVETEAKVERPGFTVLVITFDRPEPLRRSLNSVAAAAEHLQGHATVDLIISIDRAAPDDRRRWDNAAYLRRRALTIATAHSLRWPHGRKDIRSQLTHLGLARQWFENLPDAVSSVSPGFFLILEDDMELSRVSLSLLLELDHQLEVLRDDRVAQICLNPLERPAPSHFFWYERFGNYTCDWAPAWRVSALVRFKQWIAANFGTMTPWTGIDLYDSWVRDGLDVQSTWTLRYMREAGGLVGTFNLRREEADHVHYLAVNHREIGEHFQRGWNSTIDAHIEETNWNRLLLDDERLLPTQEEWIRAKQWAFEEPDVTSPSTHGDQHHHADWWFYQLDDLARAL